MLGEQSNKKNCFFFNIVRKGGGGGLVDSKISLTEKTEIFLDFSAERGGGLTQSKRVLLFAWSIMHCCNESVSELWPEADEGFVGQWDNIVDQRGGRCQKAPTSLPSPSEALIL